MVTENRQRIYDVLGNLKSAGAITASAAGGEVFDTGGGYTDGVMVTNISACEVDTGDELYTIALQGTNTAAFGGADIVDICMFQLGDATQLTGDEDLTTGVIITPFCNNFLGTLYRYLRVYCTIAGTIATGINYSCFLSK